MPDANSLDLTTGMTLEAWVNPTAVTGASRYYLQGERQLLYDRNLFDRRAAGGWNHSQVE